MTEPCRRAARVRAPLWLLAALLLASATHVHAAAPRTPWLDAAEALARWFIDVTDDGRRWPYALTIPAETIRPGFGLGLEGGAAGVGLFAIELYRHTREPRHLALAVAAAEHERRLHLQGQYGGPDYLGGAAGSGLFLLALHAATGEARWLDWAEDVAAYHARTAVVPAPGQRFWEHSPNFPRHYTGIAHGAAGVAMFHLALYQATGGKPPYRAMAEDAYRWIRTHALPIGPADAIGFRRLTDDTDLTNWWSGGTAGIMLVQAQLHALTGNPDYLDDLRRTADGLVALAEPASPTGVNWQISRWPSSSRAVVFSYGNAGVTPALLLAAELADDPADAQRYRATAQASIDWLLSLARSEPGTPGVHWPHAVPSTRDRMPGALIGSGSVGWSLLRMARLHDDPRLHAMGLATAEHLLAIAEPRAPDQLRWRTYLGAETPSWGRIEYQLGWYDGNAGIGLFLLAAHEAATGRKVRLDVHGR